MKKNIHKRLFWLSSLLITFISLNAGGLENRTGPCDGIYIAEVSTWDISTPDYNYTVTVINVNGTQLDDDVREILIPAGTYDIARFTNVRGDQDCKIKIKAYDGPVYFNGGHGSTFVLQNCSFVSVDGRRKLVDSPEPTAPLEKLKPIKYSSCNIIINDAVNDQQGVVVFGQSSYIEIRDIKVSNPTGFAGIMVKNSPTCSAAGPSGHCGDLLNDELVRIHHVNIHHNLIQNVQRGEGMYIGDTKFLFSHPCNSNAYFPQAIDSVIIAHNTITNTGLDAIQLGSCTSGGFIHDNIITDYGLLNHGSHSNGIQIGVGTQGVNCYNNFIFKYKPQTKGHGIISLGAGIIVYIIISFTELRRMGYSLMKVPIIGQKNQRKNVANWIHQVLPGFIHNTIIHPGSNGFRLDYTPAKT